MSIFKQYRKIITDISKEATNGKIADLSAVAVEPPRDPAHGDLAANAAMVLAKKIGRNPRDLAEDIKARLAENQDIVGVDIAGPGFINIKLKPLCWQREILEILTAGTAYGDSDIGKKEKVNVEYVSANPTGPMHIGHARGAVVGDALASILAKAGYDVTREYYLNDAGSQVDVLARSAHLRYREALGENIGEIPAGLYPGDYLIGTGKALAEKYGNAFIGKPEEEWLSAVREFAINAMLEMIKDDLKSLGVNHDVFASEQAMIKSGQVEKALAQLESDGLVYTGVLEPPKGKIPEDWEPRPQTLFRSSQFGDDVDRPLKKSDGSWTYFTPDIAYHFDKFKRGHTRLIDILGADHGGYAKRIKAVVKALTHDEARCEVLLCQLVKLMRGGDPFKMSKRAGTFITLRDMVELLGKDVLRFIMLTRKNDAALEFDVDQALEQSKDNPVFYVQYAHARCYSVQRNAAHQCPAATELAAERPEKLLAQLEHPAILGLIKKMAQWPRVVEQSAESCEPHRVVFYLQELAAQFHALWNQGNIDTELRFIQTDNVDKTAAYIMLVQAVATVLASGLDCVGVTPLREMA